MTRFLLILCFVLAALSARAQQIEPESPEEEHSLFLSFIEDQLSTPDRQIRIRGIQGVLSSQASIAEITVADREGVWLRITGASIDWSRSALILRQRLEIARLAAESIEITRRPLPPEGLPAPEARAFAVPELPIAINLAELDVPSVSFGRDVFGLESALSVEGRLRLETGSLDTALEIQRLDGPGGSLSLDTVYDNESNRLDLDFALSEPQDGVVANLLNVEGRPPISLTLAGSGPMENLDLSLTLAAAGEPVLSGTGRFRQRAEGIGFAVDVGGPLARLVPARFRGFFGAETTLEATGVAKAGGGLRLEQLSLESAALRLQAAAETTGDGFLNRLSLDARIADFAGERVLLPVPGGETSVESASLAVDFGNGGGSEEWTATLDATNLATGAFSAQSATLDVSGLATDLLDPNERSITFDADGAISGIIARRADVAEALGEAIRFEAEGAWSAGEPLRLEGVELTGENLSAGLSGAVSEYAFRGDIALRTSSVAPFSALAGRDLQGSVDLRANGELRPVGGAFDLTLDGTAQDLRLGIASADPLLAGATRITGRLARTVEGFSADDFRIESARAAFVADGAFATEAADFRFDAEIEDIAHITDRASGRLTAAGRAAGRAGDLSLTFEASVPRGQILDRALTEATLAFDGTLGNETLAGRITGDAFLNGVRAGLATDLRLGEGGRQLSGIDFSAGGARLTGDVTQDPGGLVTGELDLDAADISTAAALLLLEAEGALSARLALMPQNDGQHAQLRATARGLVAEAFALENGEVEATINDLFGVPAVAGRLQASGLTAGGIEVATSAVTAETSGDATAFAGQATLANGTDISARGGLAPQDGGYRVTLEQAELEQAGVTARLQRPASLIVQGQRIEIGAVDLDIGGGRLTAEGEIGDTLDVELVLERLPLSIANAIRPDLALGGTLDGEATVTGTRDAPEVAFTLAGRDIAAAALREAGISSLGVDAEGVTRGRTLSVDARMTSPGGVRASAEGSVPLGEGPLALDLDLRSFPLSLLNARLRGQELGGTLTGGARVTGSLADPRATFTAEATGLTARLLAAFGAAPLRAAAQGRFGDGALVLETLTAAGPSGLAVTARGRVPLAGSGVALNARGTVPLSLANRLLADRGTQLAGTLTADISVSGSLTAPTFSGTLSTAGATAVDPTTNLRLSAIAVDAAVSDNAVTIRSGTAGLAGGGSIAVSGTVSTNATAGFPADLTLRLDEARYSDGDLVTATLDGSLRLAGPLSRDPLLSGNVTVARAEIVVPENLGGGPAGIDVRHESPPPGVAATLRRARASDGTPMPSGRPSVLRLDLGIEAPARIFVRGRGLDAELGGAVRITGPMTSVEPVGGFRLIRGRLSILGQRITFDEGTVSLIGDLDPFLDFVARSERRDITVFITVSGRVSDLAVDFSSQPELPEDEVLARLIFDRGVDELSPLQLAQLAAAAAELAGGDTSLLGSFRNAVGLDELDIVTDQEGGAAVRAGRYIQENVYIGVEAGSAGRTRATINLDITESLRARGSFGTNGDSDVGIFFERDY